MTFTIVTHTSPDWDCILAAYLIGRGRDDAHYQFVNTGNPDTGLLALADAVVDTGKVYDPTKRRFDHHQDPALPSAAWLVFDHAYRLCGLQPDDVMWNANGNGTAPKITPLVHMVDAADRGRTSQIVHVSRRDGLHAILSAYKARRKADHEVLSFGFGMLDRAIDLLMGGANMADVFEDARKQHADLLAESHEARAAASEALGAATVYRSLDGAVYALHEGGTGVSAAAFEAGAKVVLFRTTYTDPATVAVGISRGMEWADPHVGELAELARELLLDRKARGEVLPEIDVCLAELERWYLHPAGFFAGRGTLKAPMDVPFDRLGYLASAIDAVWDRTQPPAGAVALEAGK